MKLILATLAALLALPAAADESTKVWPSVTSYADPAVIKMHAPKHPDADATVTFWNETVHHSNEDFTLTFEGLTINVALGFNVDEGGAERVTVLPPDGYLAVPAEITVPEHESRELHIFKWRGG